LGKIILQDLTLWNTHLKVAHRVPYNVGTRKLAEWVVKNCPQFDQVILEFGTLKHPSWIHLSIAPRNRKQVLRATYKNNKIVYDPIKL
jgi:hypothetical protein